MTRRWIVLVVWLAACADASSSSSSDPMTRDDADETAASAPHASGTPSSMAAATRTTSIDPNVAIMRTEGGDIRFTYSYEDGRRPMAEGDILIPQETSPATSQTRSAVTSWAFKKWPSSIVPYVISDDLPDHARIKDAIAHWEANTALRFVARTTEADYVEFRSGTGCSSYIGRIGNRQYVHLSTGERASNVVGVAVDKTNDRVTYYYARGFATAGTTTRADDEASHFKYTLPTNKTPEHIVDVAVTPAGGTVTWYDDGSVSEGSYTDLGAQGPPVPAMLPGGKTWNDVIAIAIDPSAQVQAFYRDGTMSIGTTTALGATAGPTPFSIAAGKVPAQLAHADYKKDGSLFQLYSNGEGWTGGPLARVAFPGHCGTGTVIHEIGHAVGLLHEQTRVDRDDHVIVDYANIQAGKSSNFDKHATTTAADHGVYDFASIMHYGSYAFSANGKPTITKKDGSTFEANRTALSAGDIAGIATLYP